MNKSPRDFFLSFSPPSALHHHHLPEGRRRSMKSPKIACFRAATGSRRLDHFFLFVGAASIQLPHKGSGRRGKGLRESSLCGGVGESRSEGVGSRKGRRGGKKRKEIKEEEKNYLGASVFSDPGCNYKCIWEMSYRWRLRHKQGLFFPLSLWWVSRTCSDKADKKRGGGRCRDIGV